jgi:uncharacterized membrane protein
MPLSCVTCGTAVPDDADYCPSCGRAIVRRFAGDPLGPDAPPAVRGENRAPTIPGSEPAAVSKHQEIPLPPPVPKPEPSVVTQAPPTKAIETLDTRKIAMASTPPTDRTFSTPVSKPAALNSLFSKKNMDDKRRETRISSSEAGQPATRNDCWLGAVAYLTFLPAIAFVAVRQLQSRRFVRFHAVQSIMFWVVALAFCALGILVSNFGFLLIWLVCGILVMLAIFLTWLVLSIKALQGEWFHLPWIGSIAEQFGG